MSVENRPNINAVGLVVDVIESILKHSRGNAQGTKALTLKVSELIEKFANDVSDSLDASFPPK